MTQTLRLTGLGMQTQLAKNVVGNVANTLTATGSSSQANSYAIAEDISIFTSAASNSGARLPGGTGAVYTPSPGDSFVISNLDSNTMLVFPPTGGWINNGTVNTGSVSITTHKAGLFICIDGTNYIGILGA